jgi:hypothetical protein
LALPTTDSDDSAIATMIIRDSRMPEKREQDPGGDRMPMSL